MSKEDTFTSFGAYGCTYYPPFTCGGKKTKNKNKYISKISKIDFYSMNEYKASKHLKILKNNDLFIIIDKYCFINNDKIKNIKSHNKKCKIYDKKYTSKYVILYSKYIKSLTFKEYLLDKEGMCFTKILNYYNFILTTVSILQLYNLIHNDLHFGNILFNLKKKNFCLIDFGLSIYDLQKKYDDPNFDIKYYLKKIFIKFDPEWRYQTIEVHLSCYLLYENDTISDNMLKEIIDIYYSSSKKVFSYLFKDLHEYKKKIFSHYKKIIHNKNKDSILKMLLLESMFTWDLYQTSYIIINTVLKYDDINISSSFRDLLKSSLHYNYKKRPSIDKLKKKFKIISKDIIESDSKIKDDLFIREDVTSRKILQK